MRSDNKIRKMFAEKRMVTGAHIRTQEPCMSELIARIGYDIVWIENEHSFLDKCVTNLHVLAAQAGGAAAVVRVPWNDPVLVKPILEMGVDGIIFPMVSTVREAEKAVESCLYPPEGKRGFGPIRANQYGLISTEEYLRTANDRIFKIIQIEDVKALEELDGILEVPGIDAVVVGQNDFSGTMGKLAQIQDKEVEKHIRTVFDACRRHHIPCGISCGPSAGELDMWTGFGPDFIFMPNEFDWVRNGAKKALEMIRNYEHKEESML